MSKKNKAKAKPQKAPAARGLAAQEASLATCPYLPVAHPPTKNPTLLAISAILFVGWFVYLFLAATWG